MVVAFARETFKAESTRMTLMYSPIGEETAQSTHNAANFSKLKRWVVEWWQRVRQTEDLRGTGTGKMHMTGYSTTHVHKIREYNLNAECAGFGIT